MAGRVNEQSTAIYSGQMVDETGATIMLGAIQSLSLTLYDEKTGTILGGRNGQNVLNQNDVVVGSTGSITWTMQPVDNTIVLSTCESESHVALFVCFYGPGGTKSLKHEFGFRVVNLGKVQ